MDSESKRLQALNALINRQKQRKTAIRAALSSVDLKPKNKVVFDDEGIQLSDVLTHTTSDSDKKLRPLLGSDDESDGEFNFEHKKQFEGTKGQKLLALKSKYQNDKRFALDELFVEDEVAEGDSQVGQNETEISIAEEKRKELEILGTVLGTKPLKLGDPNERRKQKEMVRFDPALPEHSRYLVKVPEMNNNLKKKTKKLRETEENMEIEQPVVSKEIFHKVSDNLKEALEEKQQFSLLSLFGQNTEENEEISEEYPEEIKTKTKSFGKNPFRYDSSSDDENEETTDKKIIEPNTSNKSQLWNEPFFFLEGDSRLQEGLDFMKKTAAEGKFADFQKCRTDLKGIVRAKLRNSQKGNNPFKKKLGGNKKQQKKYVNRY